MSEIIIIAGPQAAGKSSLIANLPRWRKDIALSNMGRGDALLFPMQESRQIVVHKHMLLGGIWMTVAHETEVITCDMERMDLILRRNEKRLVYVDECNIFTIAHARAHGLRDMDYYWDEYISRLKQLHAKIVFLDTPPDVSWQRRRDSYRRRLVYFPPDQHEGIMDKYYGYIKSTYPELLNVYRSLPFPKRMVRADVSRKEVFRAARQALAELSGLF